MLTELIVMEAFLRSMRLVACVTGALVVVDSIGVLARHPERPPHHPRANATAWLIAGSVTTLVAGFLLATQTGWVGGAAPQHGKIAITVLWAGLSLSFTARAVTRAHRPRLVILSVILMGIFALLLALADPGG